MSIISFGNNAGMIFERRGLHDILWSLCTHHEHLTLHNSAGEVLTVQYLPSILCGHRSYNGYRGELHEALYYYAKAIGVDIRLGQDVTEYWEDKENSVAGVVTNGKRLSADVVIGADGKSSIKSDDDDKPKSSGCAIFRTWLDTYVQGIDKDPLTDYLVKNGDAFHGWIGPDVHLLVSSSPRCAAILTKAPSCVDWKLYRDPLPQWISKGARLALIGDAAHPFLPTSIQGASQAVEDGITLAIVLQLAGKKDAPLAARPEAKGKEAEPPRPKWLLGFDAEKHAYGMYEEIAKEIKEKGYRPPILPSREPVEGETGN
ncbi:monooxygenase [Sanghuangporus baumii]|uniref:Monooxygenase n=1 Tax=Sanghuangporus baumii TaxID=108892 RepID=A0A9Q5N7B1_SANBA|nr:monooxygenase [Sanghuangporus baumii]